MSINMSQETPNVEILVFFHIFRINIFVTQILGTYTILLVNNFPLFQYILITEYFKMAQVCAETDYIFEFYIVCTFL